MKKLFAIAAVAALALCTGCKSVPKGSSGYYAGATIHQGYTKIADKLGPEFKDKVEALWVEVDAIETIDQLYPVYTKIADQIDALLQEKELSKSQITVIKALRKLADKAVAAALDKDLKSEKRDNAIEWLRQLREGIRVMRKLEAGEEVALPDYSSL